MTSPNGRPNLLNLTHRTGFGMTNPESRRVKNTVMRPVSVAPGAANRADTH